MQTVAQPPAADPAQPAAPATPAEPAKPAPVVVDAKWRPPAVEGVKRDDAVMGQVAERFAKLGLNTAQAEAIVALSDELSQAGLAAQQKASEAASLQQHQKWGKELEVDPEIGGAKHKENLVLANKAVTALFGPEGAKLITEAGLSNWPPLVKAMYRAATKISEDTLQDGNRPAPPVPDALAKLKAQYPKSPQLWDPTHPEFQGARK